RGRSERSDGHPRRETSSRRRPAVEAPGDIAEVRSLIALELDPPDHRLRRQQRQRAGHRGPPDDELPAAVKARSLEPGRPGTLPAQAPPPSCVTSIPPTGTRSPSTILSALTVTLSGAPETATIS